MTPTRFGIVDGRAFGGSMRVVVTRPEDLSQAKAAADLVVAEIDAAASRFRDDSELSRLNATPGRDVAVSPLLAKAIAAALRGASLTGGAVDPTVGAAVRLAGYDGDFDRVPGDGPSIQLVEHRIPGWRSIRFSAALGTVRIPKGVELDLGATAKALASDLAAEAARLATRGGGVLVSLGGDIAVAGQAPAGGWSIQVAEDSAAPIREGEETVSIAAGGLATSSITVRRWTRGGAVLHHIIDPNTGLPADGRWRTVTVAAATCVDANIASTAAIVKGEQALAWLVANRLAARLVDRQGRVRRVAGWPQRPIQSSPPTVSEQFPRKLDQHEGVSKTGARVLVVDDEPNITELVAMALRYEGFDVKTAATGRGALTAVTQFDPALVILDLMLPDIDGIEVLRRLNHAGAKVPIIFLTAKDATEDKVHGLTIGGDDYVTKPFSVEELMARVRVVLRRHGGSGAETGKLALADLELDDEAHEVRRHGHVVELTNTEYRLLRYLLVNAGRVLTRSQILDHVWHYDFGGDASVLETYVSYLRRKVDRYDPPLIQTVRGVGYVLRTPRK